MGPKKEENNGGERTRIEDVDKRRIVDFGRRKGFTAEDEDTGACSSHSVPGSSIRRWTHILKHEPSLVCRTQSDMHTLSILGQSTQRTGNLESSQIAEVLAVNTTTTKDVNNVVNQRSGVSLAGYGDIANAGELLPGASIDIKGPGIVVMIRSVRAAESDKPGVSQHLGMND